MIFVKLESSIRKSLHAQREFAISAILFFKPATQQITDNGDAAKKSKKINSPWVVASPLFAQICQPPVNRITNPV